jgi:hypothetical protein
LGAILKNFNNQFHPQKSFNRREEREGYLKKALITILMAILSASIICTALAPTANAAPENIRILSYSWYTYPDTGYGPGDFIVVGEIQNMGTTTVDRVAIRGVPYTADGQAQAEFSYPAYVENMLPGQKAPFYLDFTYQAAFSGNMSWDTMVDHVDLSAVYAEDTDVQPFSGLQIVANTSYPDPLKNNLYTVTGIIANNGNQPSPSMVWVVTTFYNASGTVVAVNWTAPLTTTSVAPGQSLSFLATPEDYTQLTSGQITSHSVIVQSRQLPTSSSSPEPSSSDLPTPSVSPTVSTQPTPSTGTDQSPLSTDLIYAIGGAVIIVVVIAVMLLIRKRRK